ncbi:hypothetical protein GIB67_006210 [Kingdonia uniflora]|uniref:KIB1-4 beta-propeller domain-containing protein n=1 Tax=Kingdonia uniflora TaxID=39325 RepID=A0A7J7LCK7_9MAGN|nr:hypothetical protein GIB67_006210 [Kingdonia uniflora]
MSNGEEQNRQGVSEEENVRTWSDLPREAMEVIMQKLLIDEKTFILNMDVIASKYGWLLVRTLTDLFFLNPFTKVKINLPFKSLSAITMQPSLLLQHLPIALFSSLNIFEKVRPEKVCLFEEIRSLDNFSLGDFFDYFLRVSALQPGDETWTTGTFNVNFKFTPRRNVVYRDGCFNFCSGEGALGTFDAAERTWTILIRYDFETNRDIYMHESFGELLLVNEYCQLDTPKKYKNMIDVYKLNGSQMGWDVVQSLGDRALFLG